VSRKHLLTICTALAGAGWVHAAAITPPATPPPQKGTPIYSQDTNLNHFTGSVQGGDYATFISGYIESRFAFTDSSLKPYTPTTAILTAPAYPRVIGDGTTPVIVQFTSPVSDIVVFPNLDHVGNNGSFGWDSYQYTIYGGNIVGNVIDFTLLFDPLSVTGIADPTGNTDPHFTLGTWSGTGPTLVNSALTPGAGGQGGNLGYEAYFHFGSAYQFYGFGTSTLSTTTGEVEQELSAVAQVVPTPEPTTWATVLIGFGLVGLRSVALYQKRVHAISSN
jgi:hypothetical protein